MVYNRVMKICFIVAFIALVSTTVVFATTNVDEKKDNVNSKVMVFLKNVQKYSWPAAVVVLVFAMYQYYVVGAEAFDQKVGGQKLIVGLSVFMVIIQIMPLAYAFATIGK